MTAMTFRGVVIDVSNVCASAALPPLGRSRRLLTRLELVVDAWRREYGDASSVILVADNSLRYAVPEEQQPEVERLIAAGVLRTAPVADTEILDLAADDEGLAVMSRDQFRDLRRRHPWIVPSAHRFLSWRYDQRERSVDFVPSGIHEEPVHRLSQAEELKELTWQTKFKPKRPAHRKLLTTLWRCTSPGCRTAEDWSDGLLLWPLIKEDRALCPECRSPLQELGRRGAIRQIVLTEARTDQEIIRFPVSEGKDVTIGRGPLAHGINLGFYDSLAGDATRRISRQHLTLELDDTPSGPLLRAADLGSSNGTTLRRPSGKVLRMPRGVRFTVSEADTLVLADAVLLRVSGRRYPHSSVFPDLGDEGGAATLSE